MDNMFSRIIVGVDDSKPSRDAVVLAARLAREHDGSLILFHALHWQPPIAVAEWGATMTDPVPMLDNLRQEGRTELAHAAQTAERLGIDAELRIEQGDPAECLVRLAVAQRCGLIVMGTHGRRGLGRLLQGSTTEAVLRLSAIPVLTVRPGETIADETRHCFERIVVGLDDSEPSDAAAQTIVQLPAADRRHVLFYSVADTRNAGGWAPYRAGIADALNEQAQQTVERALALARACGVSSEGRVIHGSARDALISAARGRRADLIVLGSHGRRGMRRFFLGSVAESIVRVAPIPVLVVRTVAA
jgi:nucleotide-binding universal stress UspA family protein